MVESAARPCSNARVAVSKHAAEKYFELEGSARELEEFLEPILYSPRNMPLQSRIHDRQMRHISSRGWMRPLGSWCRVLAETSRFRQRRVQRVGSRGSESKVT